MLSPTPVQTGRRKPFDIKRLNTSFRRLRRSVFLVCFFLLFLAWVLRELWRKSSRSVVAHQDQLLEEFPDDLFSKSQRANGALILHFIGVTYMFLGLSIVCDDYFVSSLEIFSEKLDLRADVAGATFMAAGGSAPELFTSVIGVFVAESEVGFGTIVGSAVFNVLFVVGLCAWVTGHHRLPLDWWPLARDSTYYGSSLLVLVGFISDSTVRWYEAVILFVLYGGYVLVMYFNESLETWFKLRFQFGDMTRTGVETSRSFSKSRRMDETTEQIKARIHELEDMSESHSLPLKTSVLKKRSSSGMPQSRISAVWAKNPYRIGFNKVVAELLLCVQGTFDPPNTVHETHACRRCVEHYAESDSEEATELAERRPLAHPRSDTSTTSEFEGPFSWPSERKEQLYFLVALPLNIVMALTIPDCRRDKWRRWHLATFAMSLLWIAAFTYLMVWCATTIGKDLNIPDEVMGLTVLAAGTSIPDAISSVIVAKQGFGDMAVSSSLGSNVFDILVGLPVPWMLKTWISGPLKIDSKGLIVSVLLLTGMVGATIISIKYTGWCLNRKLSFVMIGLYVVFITISLLLSYDKI